MVNTIIALKIKTIQVNIAGVPGTHTQLKTGTVEDGDHIVIVVPFVPTKDIYTVQNTTGVIREKHISTYTGFQPNNAYHVHIILYMDVIIMIVGSRSNVIDPYHYRCSYLSSCD
jgi:hypothetical protein